MVPHSAMGPEKDVSPSQSPTVPRFCTGRPACQMRGMFISQGVQISQRGHWMDQPTPYPCGVCVCMDASSSWLKSPMHSQPLCYAVSAAAHLVPSPEVDGVLGRLAGRQIITPKEANATLGGGIVLVLGEGSAGVQVPVQQQIERRDLCQQQSHPVLYTQNEVHTFTHHCLTRPRYWRHSPRG